MIEAGLEFSKEKKSFSSYGGDFLIASIAAILPVLLWLGYFIYIIQSHFKSALLAGLSSAPTSAGVLFVMMGAAGLSATWVFKKARVLAVLDDVVTILLLTFLQIFIIGFDLKSLLTIFLIASLFFISFRWQNILQWPFTKKWLLFYAFIISVIVFFIQKTVHIHLEVLVPAFMMGCLIQLKHDNGEESIFNKGLDVTVKGLFMFLVGASFPKLAVASNAVILTGAHVVMLTLLANLGKYFLVFCYSHEASLKERMALGIAMFPRGEVGAAVLFISIGYGLKGYENTLAMISLVFNLILTGVFIAVVINLLKDKRTSSVQP